MAAADVLADSMLDLVAGATAVVPIPRIVVRRQRYGIDPGLAIAMALARRTGIPLVAALKPTIWGPKHAGLGRDARVRPRYRLGCAVPDGAILVDDVVTTGVTISAASEVCGLHRAVTATSRVSLGF